MSLLGAELSSEILQKLPEGFSDMITSGINNLPTPSAELVGSVLEEFSSFMSLPSAAPRKALEQPEKPGEPDVVRVQKPQVEASRSPYDIIFYSQPRKVAVALSAERACVTAFILSLLPPVQAKEVISFMSERKKELDAAMRAMKSPPIASHAREMTVKIVADRLERFALG